MSDTPRTDAAQSPNMEVDPTSPNFHVDADFARELERELAAQRTYAGALADVLRRIRQWDVMNPVAVPHWDDAAYWRAEIDAVLQKGNELTGERSLGDGAGDDSSRYTGSPNGETKAASAETKPPLGNTLPIGGTPRTDAFYASWLVQFRIGRDDIEGLRDFARMLERELRKRPLTSGSRLGEALDRIRALRHTDETILGLLDAEGVIEDMLAERPVAGTERT